MTPTHIKQVLNIRMLRAEKAERALTIARSTESQAFATLRAAEAGLATFDASYDERIAAFFEKTMGGVTPDLLHSARGFHADLAAERGQIVTLIVQAEHVVALAQQQVAEARKAWVDASRSAESLSDIYSETIRAAQREHERIAEHDADELAVARAFRDAG